MVIRPQCSSTSAASFSSPSTNAFSGARSSRRVQGLRRDPRPRRAPRARSRFSYRRRARLAVAVHRVPRRLHHHATEFPTTCAKSCISISTANSPMPHCRFVSSPGPSRRPPRAGRDGRATRDRFERRRSDRPANSRSTRDPSGRAGNRRRSRLRHRLNSPASAS